MGETEGERSPIYCFNPQMAAAAGLGQAKPVQKNSILASHVDGMGCLLPSPGPSAGMAGMDWLGLGTGSLLWMLAAEAAASPATPQQRPLYHSEI